MKNVIVLGSTGTLGRAALKVLKKYEKYFRVFGLAANENAALLKVQQKSFYSNNASPASSPKSSRAQSALPAAPSPLLPIALLSSHAGSNEIIELIRSPKVDIILNLVSGLAGLPFTEAALKSGKTLLLANKESLVAAGKRLMKMAAPGQIIPLDSEHNAIFEILKSLPAHNSAAPSTPLHNGSGLHSNFRNVNQPPLRDVSPDIEAIYLPCSGGPLLGLKKSQLKNVTIDQVIAHPVWKMGPKVTVESATLLNKGFEIIEAHYLFNLPLSKIKVFIHPEGKIHGIVKFRKKKLKNGSSPTSEFLAYGSRPSMALHLENALRHAANLPSKKGRIKPLTPTQLKSLTAQTPDHSTFPGIKIVLAAFASSLKPSSPHMKNFLKHEEKLIAQFLANKISFLEILEDLSVTTRSLR